jgi:hypothetical protein
MPMQKFLPPPSPALVVCSTTRGLVHDMTHTHTLSGTFHLWRLSLQIMDCGRANNRVQSNPVQYVMAFVRLPSHSFGDVEFACSHILSKKEKKKSLLAPSNTREYQRATKRRRGENGVTCPLLVPFCQRRGEGRVLNKVHTTADSSASIRTSKGSRIF